MSMNYLIRERRERLAAEYALGTLRGRARRRYLEVLLRYPQMRPPLWRWEQCFLTMTDAIERSPPRELKQHILKRIGK